MLEVTCAIIYENNKILTTQLGGDSVHPFQWEFPGGKIEKGETAEQCIKRELQEELDVEVKIIDALEPVTYDYGFREIKLIPFLCRIQAGKIKLKEHVAYKCVNLQELKSLHLAAADKMLLHQTKNNAFLEKHFGKQVNHARNDNRPAHD